MSTTSNQSGRDRILVVDDETGMRRTLTDILRAEGYSVDSAASGEEAVDKCLGNGYSVVLMDVRMPGIDGVEAFRRIRQHRDDVRVILMSAYGLDALKQAALEEGAVAFLDKPLDLDKVIGLIREATDTAILVVEQEDVTAEIIRNALRDKGYRVTVAASARQALELVEQIRFDLVFVDVALPSMSGLDFYLALKKITPTAVAVMLASTEGDWGIVAEEAVRHSAYAIVKKPVDIDQILGLLGRITGGQASGHLRKPDAAWTD